MPAAKKPTSSARETHLNTRDIMQRLGVSYRTASRYMSMFDAQGKAFHVGNIIRVPSSVFEEWYAKCYGKGKVTLDASHA